MIIVGNKIDLEMENREIGYDEGKRYAEEQGYPFFETSAKCNINVDETFNKMIDLLIEKTDKTRKEQEKECVVC